MPMYFEDSSNVTLLFSFWDVQGPGGMVLSVFVVLLLTVLYELLKVAKTWMSTYPLPTLHAASPQPEALTSSPSESSLAPLDTNIAPTKKWLWHILETFTHVVQVTLGYMLMLCVMSYNVWIFLGVILGSLIGYFVAFPLISQNS